MMQRAPIEMLKVLGTSYGNAKEELKEAPKGFWRRLFGQ